MTQEYNLYSTEILTSVINEMVRPDPRFFSSFFSKLEQHDGEEIYVDKIRQSLMVMAYSQHENDAPRIQVGGTKMDSFRPAQLQEMMEYRPKNSYARMPGESLGGSLTPKERTKKNILSLMQGQADRFERRIEVMACEVTKFGKLNIEAISEPKYVVDFGRSGKLHEFFESGEKNKQLWTSKDFDVSGNIEYAAKIVMEESSHNAGILVLGFDSYAALKRSKQFKDMWASDPKHSNSNIKMTPESPVWGATKRGYFGEFEVWVHSARYSDSFDKKTKYYIDPNYALLMSKNTSGTRHHGAIVDLHAINGSQKHKTPYFSKSDLKFHPSMYNIITQSSVLTVPDDPNTSVYWKVC